MDIVDQIIAFENGEMEKEEATKFFQELIDTGMVWELQGSYGRTAKALIQGNLCTAAPKEGHSCKETS